MRNLALKRSIFCFGQKKKWDGDWLSYWFYVKIAHTSSRSSTPKFPFACMVEAASYKTTAEFLDSDSFALCGPAFELATRTLTSRDIYEEFFAAKVWPLRTGLKVGDVEMKDVEGLDHKMHVPKFGISKPLGCIESLFVTEIERAANDILGLYSMKEHQAMLAQFGCEIRINRVLAEMGIEVDVRGASAKKKGKDTGKSEVVATPKAKAPQPELSKLRKGRLLVRYGSSKRVWVKKKKKIIADEGIPSSPEEGEHETTKIDESVAEDAGKYAEATELASSCLFISEEVRCGRPLRTYSNLSTLWTTKGDHALK